MRILPGFLAGLSMLAQTGCVLSFDVGLGNSDDSGSGGTNEVPSLPAPDNAQETSQLTAEQQTRKDEVDRYIADTLYKGYTIVRTVQDANGDTIDWIATDTMAALPYAPPELSWSVDQLVLPAGVELAVNPLDLHPELLGPIGTTPMLRPMYWGYIMGETDAISIEDYLDRYQISGAPAAAKRLYAGMALEAPTRGVSGYMNPFQPQVEKGTFSLMEFAVACPAPSVGPSEELVGVVLSVDKANPFDNGHAYATGSLRLHVEHYRKKNGQHHNAWDLASREFVPNPLSKHLIGGVVAASTPGGLQIDHRIEIVQSGNGDWWLIYGGNILGYYPASLFTMLKQGGCMAAWYTETYAWTNSSVWVATEIGTGQFPDQAGSASSAWVRQPKFRDLGWFEQDPPWDNYMYPYDPKCYLRTPLIDYGGLVGKKYFVGGPGGLNNPACLTP